MSDANRFLSRRQFCAGACQAASCAALTTLTAACGGASSPTGPSPMPATLGVVAGRFTGEQVQVTLSGSALADVGGAALVESTAGLFLLSRASATAFVAVDGVCTHEGCTITTADGDVFVCPCHGSRYSRGGQLLGGPARSSLRQYATAFAGDVVSIAL